jgi:hypothetical protein
VLINQQVAPNDFSDSGVYWELLGPVVTVTGDSLSISLGDAANGYVIADAIRIEKLP